MHILIMNGDRAGEQVELKPPKITIGRELDNDISLLVVGMSRYHAELELKPPSWILRDLGSTNGIKVNGSKIKHHYSVRDGDEIEIGRIKLKYDKTPLKKEDEPTVPKVIKGKMIERTKAEVQKTDKKQDTSIKAENSGNDTVEMKLDSIEPSTATSIGLTLKKPSNKNLQNEETPKKKVPQKEEKDNDDFEKSSEKQIKIEENNEDSERLKEEEAKAKIEVAKVAKIKKEEEQAKADQLKREEAKAKIEAAKAAKAKIESKPKLSLKKDTKEPEELEEQEESPKEELNEKETELEAQKRRLKELRKKREEMRKSHKNLPKIEKDKDLGDVATNTRNINKKAFMKFFDK